MLRNWFVFYLLCFSLPSLQAKISTNIKVDPGAILFSLSGGIIGSDQTICAGSTPATFFNIAAATGGTGPVSYQWQYSADGNSFENIPSATSISYSAAALISTAYFRRRAKDGVNEVFSNIIKVTVNPVPASPGIIASSATSFCSGDSVVLTSSSAETYQWLNNGQVISGEDGQSIRVTSSGSYAVSVGNAGGCTSVSASTAVLVNPNPVAPTIRAGSSTVFCAGQSVTLTSSAATTYQWFKDGILMEGETEQFYTATVSGTYAVAVSNQFGCTVTGASTVVTVNPLPDQPIITPGGPTAFCLGEHVVLTSSSASAYQWFKDGVPVDAASSKSLTATIAGEYTVMVKNSFGCESSMSLPLAVNTKDLPVRPEVTADGPLSFCQGESVTLRSTPATTYQWVRDGVAITAETGQTTTVSVTGNYALVVTNKDGCMSETLSSTRVNVNPLPARPTVVAAGPLVFCEGGSVVLSSSLSDFYQWYKDGQALLGSTAQRYTATETGRYTVLVQTAAGCVGDSSVAAVITVNALPSAPSAIVGAVRVFAGSTQVYSVTTVAGATGYSWTLPPGWTGTSTSTTITVTAGTQGGTIAIRSTANGCSSSPVSLAVAILSDQDKDGIADDDDLDDDNDGILDVVENGACATVSEKCDTDGDGVPNRFDLDSDGDGIPDVWEANGKDDDNDGKSDGPIDPQGVPFSASTGLNPTDTDRDGKLEPYDVDSNNDGIPDGETLLVWKTVKSPNILPDGSMELVYTIILSNMRKEPIVNVQIKEDLTRTFPLPIGFSVVSLGTSGVLTKADDFDGRSAVNLLRTGTVLPGLTRDSITLKLRISPNGFKSDLSNLVDGYAEARWFNVERQSIDINKSNGRLYGSGLPTVISLPEVRIIIPDVITPNNDGLNDRFIIQRPSDVRVGLMIFNSSGIQVFKTDDYKNDWDGRSTLGSGGRLLPSGTYFYVATFRGRAISGTETRKGYLTLKREG